MKITINKSKFEKHLENISKAVQSSSTLPALKGILMVASESNVILTASTGNLSIKEVIEKDGSVNVIEPGSILIEGALFKNIIKKL
ncbi:MAG: DNA polymerase III subunit beta, partial [Mycoplasmataceae bacterium]|nr:DNA polymerase III subunit beta [Mycoplasmataceae bacterium]